jgi:hypothetical protein
MSCCLPNKKIIASVIPPVSLDTTPESPTSTAAITLSNTFNMANPSIVAKVAENVVAVSIQDDNDPVPEKISPTYLSTIRENGDSGVGNDSLSVLSESSAEVAVNE